MPSALPFDDIRDLARRLPGPAPVPDDIGGGDGRGNDVLRWLAQWGSQPGSSQPDAGPRRSSARPPARPLVALFAGTHGVAEADTPGEAERMQVLVERIAAGGTALPGACARAGLGLKIFDLALDLPTADIRREPALDERACAATMAFGMEAVAGGTDLLVLSAAGEGGRTSAMALLAATLGKAMVETEGERAAAEALAHHGTALRDPLEALRRLGGRETAALAGAILAARTQKVPVLLDGLAALAAAAVLKALAADAIDHCIAADSGVAPAVQEALGLGRVLDLAFSGGEGVSGALAAGLVVALAEAAFPVR